MRTRIRLAVAPKSLPPMRDSERTSTRLPLLLGVTRMDDVVLEAEQQCGCGRLDA